MTEIEDLGLFIAIDFDGTCIPSIPEPGWCDVDTGAERVLKRLVSAGHNLILWTCRNYSYNNPYNYTNGVFRTGNTSLDEALEWFSDRKIPLVGVNKHPAQENIIGESRKAYFDILIDDTGLGTKLVYGEVEYISFETGQRKITMTKCVDWDWVESELERTGIL